MSLDATGDGEKGTGKGERGEPGVSSCPESVGVLKEGRGMSVERERKEKEEQEDGKERD